MAASLYMSSEADSGIGSMPMSLGGASGALRLDASENKVKAGEQKKEKKKCC